ncbi:hypothetical protein GCM10009430_32590 [Aquimarina litoralis]|uniref:2'-5' RNA ligase n=1 Tax=Aquimarina litoralis TaxID=584605 RepID=A0ABN1J1S0_9FLAO
MKNDFSSYEKIVKNLKSFNDKDFKCFNKVDWVVTEKIHGANFSFIYENRELKFAKRKELLSWKSDFFGFQIVVKQMENKVLALFEELSLHYKATKYIIYGELFGGSYPHIDVVPDKRVQAIQTGVYYNPSISFAAFDIAIVSDTKYYLSYKKCIKYFYTHDVPFLKPLFIGKLSDALNFDKLINSRIPDDLNLPSIIDNTIEGIVVKQYDLLTNSDERPIIKIKNKKFEEEKKFHLAKKWSFTTNTNSQSVELSFLIIEIRSYVTKNRLDSAISKIGTFDLKNQKRMNEIKIEFLEDVLQDFNLDNYEILEGIDSEKKDWIIDRVKADINLLIRDLYFNKKMNNSG